MRHLSLSLIVAALVLAACDMNKPKVQRTSSTQESVNTTTSAPVAAPATATAPVVQETDTTTLIEPEVRDDALSEGALVEDDILIQAEEEPIDVRSDERKTYNEKQFSDDANDYPIERTDRGETYDETQRPQN